MKTQTIMKFIPALLLVVALVGCKNDQKKSKMNETDTKMTVSEKLLIQPKTTTIQWTAYKTTEKKPVHGTFTVLNFKSKTDSDPKELLNNLNFSIPVSSLSTKDPVRDGKLKKSFFGVMQRTTTLKGTLKKNSKGSFYAVLHMNGVTHNLPLSLKIIDKKENGNKIATLEGTMHLKQWKALKALEILNKACFDLHKGPDGVSKTWEDVNIKIEALLEKK